VDNERSMHGCAAHQQYRKPFFLLQDKIFGARFRASAAASMRYLLVWVFLLFSVTFVTLSGSYGNDGYANAPQYYVKCIWHVLLN